MSEITIKKKGVVITASRQDLIEVQETPDGVVFNFDGGLMIYYNDPHMKSANKQIIKNTADIVKEKKLIFDLNNPNKPAMVDAT